MTLVGLISDTHGLLRPEATLALGGCDLILHAGDVGDPGILERLAQLAPVQAVRGNVDAGAWADSLPKALRVVVEEVVILLHHGHLPVEQQLLDYAQVVVEGHSHRATVEHRGERLVVNPGSAGRRRFRLPVTLALLRVVGSRVEAEVIDLLGTDSAPPI